MLSLNSASCGVYIIVFKISLAMLFYGFFFFLITYTVLVFLCRLFFIWGAGNLVLRPYPLRPCRDALFTRRM